MNGEEWGHLIWKENHLDARRFAAVSLTTKAQMWEFLRSAVLPAVGGEQFLELKVM